MAEVAKGPGQQENFLNLPGTYQDPQSGAMLHVTMPAGADALVRMGWEYIGDEVPDVKDMVPDPSVKESLNNFSVQTTVSGKTIYRNNGKIISKEAYEKGVSKL